MKKYIGGEAVDTVKLNKVVCSPYSHCQSKHRDHLKTETVLLFSTGGSCFT